MPDQSVMRRYISLCRKAARELRTGTGQWDDVAILIDLSADLGRAFGAQRAMAWAKALLPNATNAAERGRAHYFVANAWSVIRQAAVPQLRTPAGTADAEWQWSDQAALEEVAHLREACRELETVSLESSDARLTYCQVLTNLGNAFSRRGRVIEAIKAFDTALLCEQPFGMAHGNRGIALLQYSRMVPDEGHQVWLLRESHAALGRATDGPGAHPSAITHFAHVREQIESSVPAALLAEQTPWQPERRWGSREQAYRAWVAAQRLFLNDLNDVTTAPITMHDFATLPTLTTALDAPAPPFGAMNQIVQEFVAARHLLYTGRSSADLLTPHFADRDVTLVDTLDYPLYSVRAEWVRLAFRSLYSLFDKIAFLLNEYLNLQIPLDQLAFRRFWYRNNEFKRGLRPELTSRRNPALIALFSLSGDLFDPKAPSSYFGAGRLNDLRDELEHKYLKLHFMGPLHGGRPRGINTNRDDRSAYSVNVAEFFDLAVTLAQLVRAAILYAILAIRVEEQQRTFAAAEGTTLPSFLPRYRHP